MQNFEYIILTILCLMLTYFTYKCILCCKNVIIYEPQHKINAILLTLFDILCLIFTYTLICIKIYNDLFDA